MEKDVTQSADFYRLVAWLHANKKQLTTIGVTIAVVAALVGGYIWFKNYKETSAANAISNIKPPTSAQDAAAPTAADAQPFIKTADDHSGTKAAARALLVAGGIQFTAGKFDLAQATFERFLREYPENAFANQAMLGVASSLEAQGKAPEAIARYEDLVKRHQSDSTTPQAKSALGRLYLGQNKPEQAMHYYEDLVRVNNNDSWSAEAGIQLQELLAKYPELKKPAPAPPSMPVPTATGIAPTAQ